MMDEYSKAIREMIETEARRAHPDWTDEQVAKRVALVVKTRSNSSKHKGAYRIDKDREVFRELPPEKYALLLEDDLAIAEKASEKMLHIAIEQVEKQIKPRKKGAENNKRKALRLYEKFKKAVKEYGVDIVTLKKSALESTFHPLGINLKEGQLYNYQRRLRKELQN